MSLMFIAVDGRFSADDKISSGVLIDFFKKWCYSRKLHIYMKEDLSIRRNQ